MSRDLLFLLFNNLNKRGIISHIPTCSSASFKNKVFISKISVTCASPFQPLLPYLLSLNANHPAPQEPQVKMNLEGGPDPLPPNLLPSSSPRRQEGFIVRAALLQHEVLTCKWTLIQTTCPLEMQYFQLWDAIFFFFF